MKAIKHNGKELNFHFGMEFLDIFCFELGNEMSDLDKIGTEAMKGNTGIKIFRDILYSCAKTYAILNDKPFDFKLIEFTSLATNPNFNSSDFVDKFLTSFQSTVPKALPKTEPVKKK